MSSKDLQFVKTNNIDIYGLLEIESSSTDAVIRKAYRRKALQLHPDKNPSKEAADAFHKISISMNILTNNSIRKEYDDWVQGKELEKQKYESLNKERKRMADELNRNESNWNKRRANESSNRDAIELERLRQEGLNIRKQFQSEYSIKLNTSNMIPTTEQRITVKVKWKPIPNNNDVSLQRDIIEGLLSVFGRIIDIKILKKDTKSRYDSAIVEFEDMKSAQDAITHDLKDRSIWENSQYRKTSGLLREIKYNSGGKDAINSNRSNKDLPFLEYLEKTVRKLQKIER